MSGRTRMLYIGVTNDLLRRVQKHKTKLVPGFTAKFTVDRLVYFEEGPDVVCAIEREKQLKSWTRKKKIADRIDQSELERSEFRMERYGNIRPALYGDSIMPSAVVPSEPEESIRSDLFCMAVTGKSLRVYPLGFARGDKKAKRHDTSNPLSHKRNADFVIPTGAASFAAQRRNKREAICLEGLSRPNAERQKKYR